MSTEIQTQAAELNQAIMKVVMAGDLTGLNEVQRFQYYTYMCKKAGLDAALSPFEYIRLNNKLVLYAKKGAAEQLRSIHHVSLERMSQKVELDTILIETRAKTPDGRVDVGLGAVACKGLTGSDLANAFMRCETKSKRRATLSICGLNMPDESELADMSNIGGVHPEQPMDGDGVENLNPHKVFTRGKFAKRGPEEVDIQHLRNWVLQVEERLVDPKKALEPAEREEWEWNVRLALHYIVEFEANDVPDFGSEPGAEG